MVFSDEVFVLSGAPPLAGVRSSEGSMLNTPSSPMVLSMYLLGAPTVELSCASFTLIVNENPETTNNLN